MIIQKMSRNFVVEWIQKWFLACLVAQSCPTFCNPLDSSPPGSPVPEIFQATILEWVAFSFSKGIPLTQGLNLHLLCFLHCRQILYPLNHWRSPQRVIFIHISQSLICTDSMTMIVSYFNKHPFLYLRKQSK